MSQDFLRYYDLEGYLLAEVGPRFRETSKISAFDFFCILIWKSNRAKTKHARRMLSRGYATLERAVDALAHDLSAAPSRRERGEVQASGGGVLGHASWTDADVDHGRLVSWRPTS